MGTRLEDLKEAIIQRSAEMEDKKVFRDGAFVKVNPDVTLRPDVILRAAKELSEDRDLKTSELLGAFEQNCMKSAQNAEGHAQHKEKYGKAMTLRQQRIDSICMANGLNKDEKEIVDLVLKDTDPSLRNDPAKAREAAGQWSRPTPEVNSAIQRPVQVSYPQSDTGHLPSPRTPVDSTNGRSSPQR